jgi:uncharacterized protein (TIGR03086 family)
MDALEMVKRAYDSTARYVAGVRPGQFSEQTPCTDWNTGQLVNHIIYGLRMFGACASGSDFQGDPAAGTDRDVIGDDPIPIYQEAAKFALEAWRRPGAMEMTITLPFADVPGVIGAQINAMETLVHGWDLARASGQDPTLDPQLAAAVLAFTRQAVPADETRPPWIGPAVAVPADASPTAQLVAYLGRRP